MSTTSRIRPSNRVFLVILICSAVLFPACSRKPISPSTGFSHSSTPTNISTATNTLLLPETAKTGDALLTGLWSNFDATLAAMTKFERGEFPNEKELLLLLSTLADPSSLERLANYGIYTTKYGDSIDKVLFLCTNAVQTLKDPNEVNSFLHMAGAACERKAKAHSSDYHNQYWDLAKDFYEEVLRRTDSGVATKEAADSAYFLADIYKNRGDKTSAETYYEKFADYAVRLDNKPSNAEYARIQLAKMIMNEEPGRANAIVSKIITDCPSSIHIKSLRTIQTFCKMRIEDPTAPSGALFMRAVKQNTADNQHGGDSMQ